MDRDTIIEITQKLKRISNRLRDMLCEIDYLPPIEPIEESEADTVHKPDYSYEAGMVRRLKEWQELDKAIQGDAESATTTEVDYCNNCPYLPWGNDCISRKQAIEALGEEPDIAQDTDAEWAERDTWVRHIRAIESLPPVEPKPVCEDTISKRKLMTDLQGIWDAYTPNNMTDFQDMLEDIYNKIKDAPPVEPKIYGNEHNCIMTMFGECSYSETGCGSCEVVAKVFEALKDECPPVTPTVSEDCISRGHIKNMIGTYFSNRGDFGSPECFWIMKAIKNAPSVTPTERTGEWKHTMTHYPYCSECEWMPEEDEMTHGRYNYCPDCGAKMKG